MTKGQGGGPKTEAGKARSSRNAVKHGLRSPHPFIIEGVESAEEWEELKLGIIESWQPVGMQELELATNIAYGHLRLRRCRLVENGQIRKQVAETEYELQQEDALEDEDYDEDDDSDTVGAHSLSSSADAQAERRSDAPSPEDAPLPEIDPERLLAHQHLKLIPDGWSIDRLLRTEAFVRKTLTQDMHELEVLQARRLGERTPMARVFFNSDPSAAKVRHAASDIPAFQIARERVRLAELALSERRRAARAANNAGG